jgi:hypothetical protein
VNASLTPFTEEELEAAIDSVSMGYYRRASEHDKAKIRSWLPGLQAMSDKDFVVEAASRILDSAIMNGYRGNASGIHAMADICQDEAARRHQAAGHAADCRGSDLYSRAYNLARTNQGHKATFLAPCTCGFEK